MSFSTDGRNPKKEKIHPLPDSVKRNEKLKTEYMKLK